MARSCRSAKEKYMSSVRLRKMQTAEAAKLLGVSTSAIWQWRTMHGIPCPQRLQGVDVAKKLRADPDFGFKTGQAKASCKVLADRHKCSSATVWANMERCGIEKANASRGGKMPASKLRAVQSSAIHEILSAWGRPSGMGEHVKALRLNRIEVGR